MSGNYSKRFPKRLTTLCLCLMLAPSLFWGCRSGPQPDHAQGPAPMGRPVPAVRQDVVEEKIRTLADDLTRQFDYPHPRIVIGYFVLDGNKTNFLGERVYEILSAYISGKYGRSVMICDRRKMSDIMAELKLQQSRLFDVNTIAEIGRFAGANLMVAGEIRRMGRNRVNISAQLIEIETMVNQALAVTPFFAVSEDYLEKLEAVRLKNTDLAIPFDYLVHGCDSHVKHICKGDLLLERGGVSTRLFRVRNGGEDAKGSVFGLSGEKCGPGIHPPCHGRSGGKARERDLFE